MIPYSRRVNYLKTILFTAAHTYIAHIWYVSLILIYIHLYSIEGSVSLAGLASPADCLVYNLFARLTLFSSAVNGNEPNKKNVVKCKSSLVIYCVGWQSCYTKPHATFV